jgi:DNA (cytosine-5)-methyltransferase 1
VPRGEVVGMKPVLLDLFCCAGGAGMGYHRAGFEVVGVDIAWQPNYPFNFLEDDALAVLRGDSDADLMEAFGVRLKDVAAIHASPPCQSYLNLGAVNRALGRTYEHADLIAATRELLIATGMPYVIENVADARPQLIDPVRICGTGLGRPVRRHRLFESNVPLVGIDCDHGRYTEPRYWTGWRPNGEKRLSTVVQIYGNAGGREHWPAALGVDWMTAKEMTECVPPSYTEHLGRQLLAHVEERVA